jgi:hypothetical protein
LKIAGRHGGPDTESRPQGFFVNHLPYQAFTYLIIGFIAYSWLEVVRSDGQGLRV